jgi:hypothetical protein
MPAIKVDLKTHKGIAEAAYGFNDNISLTGTTLQNLRTQLEELNIEVKADEEGLVQMKAILLKIQSVCFYIYIIHF